MRQEFKAILYIVVAPKEAFKIHTVATTSEAFKANITIVNESLHKSFSRLDSFRVTDDFVHNNEMQQLTNYKCKKYIYMIVSSFKVKVKPFQKLLTGKAGVNLIKHF
jgi:hypothetical protein